MSSSDFAVGERVVVRSPSPSLPSLTGTVIRAPFPEWSYLDSVWVQFDPPAAGNGCIHRSLVRRLPGWEESDA